MLLVGPVEVPHALSEVAVGALWALQSPCLCSNGENVLFAYKVLGLKLKLWLGNCYSN